MFSQILTVAFLEMSIYNAFIMNVSCFLALRFIKFAALSGKVSLTNVD